MTYKPKNAESEKIAVDLAASEKLKKLMENITDIHSSYVEPGDIVIAKLTKDVSEEDMNMLKELLGTVFKGNKGLLAPDYIDFVILKKDQDSVSVIDSLISRVEYLENQIKLLLNK